MLTTMIGRIQKMFNDVKKPITYGTELEAYIVSKNPQNTYDVEAFAREYEAKNKNTRMGTMKSILNSIYNFFVETGKAKAATALARSGNYDAAKDIMTKK